LLDTAPTGAVIVLKMFYIISTPIGNLQDISVRALEALKSADFIVCEDTRVTKNLLNHYDINTRLIALNARTETRMVNQIIKLIEDGKNGALVSDAGTPLISDPGNRLISALIAKNISVSPIPGASAVTSALVVSGLPTNKFAFLGFIPQKKGRQTFIKSLSDTDLTTVFFESTHRIEKLIRELAEYVPDRRLSVCRELTKHFEEVWRGTAAEIAEALPSRVTKGEFVIVVAPHWFSGNDESYSEE
jgi:16S rRNA (cytidine1402-2'-O)-methyltransferase